MKSRYSTKSTKKLTLKSESNKIAIIHDWFLRNSSGGAEKVTALIDEVLKNEFSAPDLYCISENITNSKKNLLKVPLNVLKNYGAVSEETASYMVRGLSKEKDISFSMAVTGIAGPSGGTKYKPVGLVFFSFLYNKKDILVKKKLFKGNRNIVREKAANYALKKSIEIIS